MIKKIEKKIILQQKFLKNAHNHFLSKGFSPIVSPKIVPFKDDEINHLIKVEVPGREKEQLFLSRSPQFYKEIAALSSPEGKVYEIGPVFRGEPFGGGRRANEFIGLDVEIRTDNVEVLIEVLKEYLLNLASDSELISFLDENYKKFYLPTEFIVITYQEARNLLKCDFIGHKEEQVLSQRLTKGKPSWIILVNFPAELRKFYAVNENTGKSESFDLINGWEICSGGIRRRDIQNYLKFLEEIGWSTKEFKTYLEFIDHNIDKKTGGFGIGLERLIGSILGNMKMDEIQPYPRVPKKKIEF